MSVLSLGPAAAPPKTPGAASRFVCPIDRAALHPVPEGAAPGLACTQCGTVFPVVQGVPVLLNEANSVFRIDSYRQAAGYEGASGYGGSADRSRGLRRAYRAFARKLLEAAVPGPPFDPLPTILAARPEAALLVIGAGERAWPGRVTYTDVAMARKVACICDAHDLPFPDGSFDAVCAEAVLEHVCDPQRCVAEIHRVLRPGGFVWAVTPFLQPVHMGAHDFTRFTFLGHRRLFRWFDESASGMVGGPVQAGIHLFRHTLLALTDRPRLQAGLRLAGLLLTWPLRFLDRFLVRTEASLNAGCAFYFLGRKRESPIPDREIIGLFRGR
ncbi:methyltransferase domain-containing protein [Falsiroseomonas selenitidurans]|uniref:Methyltransferase domain-containing protein n=1 Tax=Falsiroseomonas selenitidurans TaxID=2716335 RepID=A0ABX1E1J8_9PROT|nr:methyltransferase domain-containing protein [Falsiroseomonas selenitidurans]NKC31025.1 methyltransferase domain-containing protein [Falsiroseomonas selenitidurans]